MGEKPRLSGYWPEDAIEEQRVLGHTDKRCLRCGTQYVREERPPGYIIRCETPGCFFMARPAVPYTPALSPEEKKRAREEVRWAEQAVEEQRVHGRTDKRCLRCGTEYTFEDAGSAYEIHCQTPGCFKMTSRGI